MKAENIKFKAKRLDGKGWVCGDLLHSYENGAIIVPIEGGGAFSVDPSTICQFTGLKDSKGQEIFVPHWRAGTAKYCSVQCQRKSLICGPNATCVVCGKPFYIKPNRLKRLKHPPCCSLKCSSLYRKVWFRGKGNHQYGLKGNKNSTFSGDVIFQKK